MEARKNGQRKSHAASPFHSLNLPSFHPSILPVLALAAVFAGGARGGEIPPEFRVKRKEPFEFAARPQVTRAGDRVTISFAAKAACDATIAVEDSRGRIVRHLASGVLGDNAPAPFEKGSLKQSVVWDGKDDLGRYIDDKAALRVRVSLGLKPRFERTLFWSPQKRHSRGNRALISASPEGVFVFEGEGCDHLRLFDHEGNYLRTVYPFPAGKLGEARGLKLATFPQDGARLPLKNGLVQATLLTSGRNIGDHTLSKYQPAATAMAVSGTRVALASERLNRLSTDGATGGLDLEGPLPSVNVAGGDDKPTLVPPRSAALSPDGKWLYTTGFMFVQKYPKPRMWLGCVMRVPFEGGEPEVFAGSTDLAAARSGSGAFKVPTSVACGPKGRVCVADYMNDRVQVFSPEGKLLKSVKVHKPAQVAVHQKTGEIYVASWMLLNQFSKPDDVKEPRFTRLGPPEDPAVRSSCPLPLADHNPKIFMNRNGGFYYTFALDSWAAEPTVWLIPAQLGTVEKLIMVRGKMDQAGMAAAAKLLVEKDGKLVVKRDFAEDVARDVRRGKPPIHSRQKMYVNPVNGRLYVFEGQAGVSKSVKDLLEIDPPTGKIGELQLPFDAEDLAFGIDGLIYLRTDNVVGRFNPQGWREVPYDYGEKRESVGFSSSGDGRRRDLISALILPAMRPGCFHQGGMHVSPGGKLVVSCYNVETRVDLREASEILKAAEAAEGRKYAPKLYPGRQRWGEVHVWDLHGKLAYEDAFKGLPMLDGVAIDKDDNLYVLASPNRVIGGEPYFLERAETLIKARPGRASLVHGGQKGTPVALPEGARPDRPPDLKRGGPYWLEGAEWAYGGVGYGGFNSAKGGGGCTCWHTRFALDYYARSFVPEVDHFSVAVLDTAGNLVMRLGRYGNVDDGQPLVPAGSPPNARLAGGDEVALFDAAYVAVHTDRRLFIADGGNARILSVKLGYAAEETVALKDVPDSAKR